ncbi:response regulator transcription factor [Gemella sp. 19428wG2_WT2a]|nr:response regulator transcription factor [Gemella sp. 19428wG2_WT2a]TFU58164.1 response regulator transcription factor [Gemella sp. WT2a]
MYKIMIIEDDEIIASSIVEYLEKWGFESKIAGDYSRVIEDFVDYSPDLVLMDINLPQFDGYHYCEQIRRLSKIPIIFMSSASDDMNIVMAVSMGADDFIAKPFKLVVLKAKIDAILRRVYNFNSDKHLISYKDLIFDLNKDKVNYKGQSIELTKNEAKILVILLENRENIVTRDEIMRGLWDNDSFVDENTLSVNVNRLRKKLEEVGIIDFIKTKKGKGYIV